MPDGSGVDGTVGTGSVGNAPGGAGRLSTGGRVVAWLPAVTA